MNDVFIKTLFSSVYEKMGLPQSLNAITEDHELVIDEQHPVFMRYDRNTEQLLLISQVEIATVPVSEQPELHKRLLRAALNPLRNLGPGVGIDDNTGLCFSYFMLARHAMNADLICKKLAELVDWNKKLLN